MYSFLALPLSAIICSPPCLVLLDVVGLGERRTKPSCKFFFYLFSFCVYLMLVTELKYGNDPVDGEVAIDFGGEKGQAG